MKPKSGLVALAHNLRKYVSYKVNEKDRHAESMTKNQENAAVRDLSPN